MNIKDLSFKTQVLKSRNAINEYKQHNNCVNKINKEKRAQLRALIYMPSWLRREWYGSTSTNQRRWGGNRRARTVSWESARTSDGAKSERWANFGETWPKGYWSRAHARCSWICTWERTSEEWSHTRERVARWGCALCEEPDQRSQS